MLTYLLAIGVGLASLSLYMAAFFFPEVYRRYDLVWSGVGMFYALVLWVCAERITGGLLLGQIASVALLSRFGYQTLQLRREQTPVEQRTPLPASANSAWEVIQVTVQQLRSSFRQSADRSPFAAQLEHSIIRLEEVWQMVRSRVDALISTTLNLPPLPQPDKPYTEWDDDLEIAPESKTAPNPEMETTENPAPSSPLDRSTDPANHSASKEIPPL